MWANVKAYINIRGYPGCAIWLASRPPSFRRRLDDRPPPLGQLQRLECKEKCRVGAARGLQDLGKIGIGERRKLIKDDADHGSVLAAPLLRILVPLSENQLQVLEQHAAQQSVLRLRYHHDGASKGEIS
jgi:hypothetical protein